MPNYYGRKITRVISYDKSVPKAVVEVEGQDGQWCVLFSALDLCTQRWILNEVWKKGEAELPLDNVGDLWLDDSNADKDAPRAGLQPALNRQRSGRI